MTDFTQRLTLQAEALGFDKSASAIDVVAAAEKRLVDVNKELEASQKTGTVEHVAKLQQESSRLRQTIGDLTGKNDQAIASMGNFGEQLKRISPLVGDVVGGLGRYNGVAGLVAVSIAGITAAARAMREEWEKTTQAIRDQADALTKIKGQDQGTQQSIEDMRASSRAGGFRTAEEASSAIGMFNRVRSAHPWITDESAVATASGFGEIAGLSVDETAGIARLIQTRPDSMGDVANTRREDMPAFLRHQLQTHSSELDQAFGLEREQKRVRAQAAGAQLRREGGSTLELQEVLSRFAPAGANLEFLAQVAQELQSPQYRDDVAGRMSSGLGIPGAVMSAIGAFVPGAGSPLWQASQADFSVVRNAMREIENQSGSASGDASGFGRNANHWKIGDMVHGVIRDARKQASWPSVSDAEGQDIDRILANGDGDDLESRLGAARNAIRKTTHLRGDRLEDAVNIIRDGIQPSPAALPERQWHPPMDRARPDGPLPGPPSAGAPSVTNVTHNHYNTRNYGAFAAAQSAAISNGETLASSMELI